MADPGARDGSAGSDVLVSWPAALVLLGSGAALGGATSWTSLGICSAIGALGVWALLSRRWGSSWLSVVLAVLAVFTLFQCVPLPMAVLRLVAPASADLWTESNALFGSASTVGTVTLEPAATRLEALRLLSYCIFAALCHHVSRSTGSRGLCASVALSAAVLALATVLHQVAEARTVFGWYQPEYARFVAPLMNPNNLSGALNLGFFCAAGLLVDPRSSEGLRGFSGLVCLLCLATSVWLGSRAGVVLLFVALALWFLREWWRLRQEDSDRASSRLLPIALAVGLGTIFAAFSVTRLSSELFDDSLEKLDVFGPGFLALKEHFPLGAGRGAFAVAVSPFVSGSDARFEHAENFLLGWGVEWGAPLALALSVLVGFWLWPRHLRELTPPRFGSYVGLCGLWVHNLADLSLEVPLVALSAVAAATAFGGFGGRVPKKPAFARFVPASALVLLGILTVAWLVHPGELGRSARHRIASAAAKGPIERGELLDVARAHPADPYLLRLVAADALARRDPNTLRWLNLALARGPDSARTLLLLADALGLSGHRDQALGALRRVVALDGSLADEAARRALALSASDAHRIVPPGPHAVAALRALARNARTPLAALEFARAAAERPDAPVEARVEILQRALTATDADCSAALGGPCQKVLPTLRASLTSDAPGLLEVDAALLSREGRADRAFELLEARCPRSPAGTACLAAWVRQGHALPLGRQLAAAEALIAAACVEPARCPGARIEVAEAFRARGEATLALQQLRKAAEQVGSADLWLRTAQLARDTGDLEVLNDALDELVRVGHTPAPELIDAREALRRAKLTPP